MKTLKYLLVFVLLLLSGVLGCSGKFDGFTMSTINPRDAAPDRAPSCKLTVGSVAYDFDPFYLVQDAATETIETVAVIVQAAGAAFMPSTP